MQIFAYNVRGSADIPRVSLQALVCESLNTDSQSSPVKGYAPRRELGHAL